MARKFNIAEAKAKLPEIVDAVLAGEDVVIARRNVPLVRLVVATPAGTRPVFGRLRGRVRLSADFDAPLDDFAQ